MRALLVEDDPCVARGTTMCLRARGIVIDVVETGEEAIELSKHYDYDIVLLDLDLPDMAGFDVVRRLRASKVETPILVVSGVSGPAARVKALSMGADDFIVKPCETDELVARVLAIVRRSKGYSQSVLGLAELQLDLDRRQVFAHGAQLAITPKEFSILQLLILRCGTVLTKDAFLNHLYGGMDEPEPKIIDVFICKLRKKLADAQVSVRIETVWSRGYVIRHPASDTSSRTMETQTDAIGLGSPLASENQAQKYQSAAA